MELTTLQNYIADAKREYEESKQLHLDKEGWASDIPFEDETLVWAIQEWHSMFGEFTKEEYQYLEETWDFSRHEIDMLIGKEEEA